MLKQLINSDLGKSFRKKYLQNILHYIEKTPKKKNDYYLGNIRFCCHYSGWDSFLICWKELKEVKEHMGSSHLRHLTKYNCREVWFETNTERICFLKECISEIK